MGKRKGQLWLGTLIRIFGWLCISAAGFFIYVPTIQNKAIAYLSVGVGFVLLAIGEFFK